MANWGVVIAAVLEADANLAALVLSSSKPYDAIIGYTLSFTPEFKKIENWKGVL